MTSDRRNTRNNPYPLDTMASGLHHSTAGALWRWRTETTAFIATSCLTGWLAVALSLTFALIIIGAILAIAGALAPSRRWLICRAWCVISRHRLQRVCWETRMHTRSGRIPLVAWIRPTDVGERAWLLCRAGICAEDLEAHSGEIRAACAAREARITRHPRWSQVVTIDVIRHDTLSAGKHVTPHILTRHNPAALPADGRIPAPAGRITETETPTVPSPEWPRSPALTTCPDAATTGPLRQLRERREPMTSLPREHASAVNTSLTPNRPRRVVENDEYAAFLHRAIRAYSRRIAAGDIEAIACMTALADEITAATQEAVTRLRATGGYSWADIAARLHITRQAAQQRWGTTAREPAA